MISNLKNECLNDKSVYSYSVPSVFLQKSLEILENQLENPTFSDDVIKDEYDALKNQLEQMQNESDFFINSAIESKVFSETPWKRNACINYASFSGKKLESVRNLLSEIQKNYYTPQNSALVITCPFTADEMLVMAKNIFAKWRKNDFYQENAGAYKNSRREKEKNKKFVIVTDAISSELNQIIVQYASNDFFSDAKNEVASLMAQTILENNSSLFKKNLCNEKKLGIIAPEYINVAFSSQGQDSRIIMQSLLQANLASAVEQCNIFLRHTVSDTKFDFEDLNDAKRVLQAQTLLSENSANQYAMFLSYNWGRGDAEKNLIFLTESIKSSDAQKVFSLEPFVFLLVNPEIYEKQKKDFSKDGWSVITKKNAFWFKTPSLAQGENEKAQTQIPDKNAVFKRIAENIRQNSFSFALSNGISVDCALNSDCATTTIILRFLGGERRYEKSMRALETILLKSLAHTIQAEIDKAFSSGAILDAGSVMANAGIYAGKIAVSCMAQDFEAICQCINNAFVFGKITPYLEDELIYLEKSKWNFLTNQLDFQLKCKALTSFFKGTSIENLFNCNAPILQNITFNQIQSFYIENFNASRISIVVTGKTDAKKLQSLMEKTFALLKPLAWQDAPHIATKFSSLTQVSRLKRIIGSNVKAENAGPRPLHLVPTTDFKDPCVVFMTCPEKASAEYPHFLVALNCVVQSINDDFALLGEKPLSSHAEIFDFDEIDGIVGIQFDEIANIKEIYRYFVQKCYSFCATSLTAERLENAKTLVESEIFALQEDSALCAEKINKNFSLNLPFLYHIDLCEKVMQTEMGDVQKVFAEYLAKPQLYWIFSAESPK